MNGDKGKKPGETLSNGYEVIENNGVIVLAHSKEKKQYVTWKFDIVKGSMYAGHYFPYWTESRREALETAKKDYLER